MRGYFFDKVQKYSYLSERRKNMSEFYTCRNDRTFKVVFLKPDNSDLLKAKYINKPFSNISIRELKEIKHAFSNLLLIAKQTQNSNS